MFQNIDLLGKIQEANFLTATRINLLNLQYYKEIMRQHIKRIILLLSINVPEEFNRPTGSAYLFRRKWLELFLVWIIRVPMTCHPSVPHK